MILTNASKRSTLLLLIVLAVCCYTQLAYAGKITTKTNTTNVGQTTTTALVAATDNEVAVEATAPSSSEEEDDDDEDDGTTSDEKTAVQATDDTTFGWFSITRNVWDWINGDLNLFGGDDSTSTKTTKTTTAAAEGRTFGKIRRLKMMLIPLIIKIGITSLMVGFLVMLSLKTFFLVKLLVIMNTVAILAKFLTLKSNFGGNFGGGEHIEHHASAAPSWGYSNWSPHGSSGWATTGPAAPVAQHPSKEIHLHIHGGGGGHGGSAQPQVAAYSTYGVESQASHGWQSRSDPYGAYEQTQINEADLENELNNEGPISLLPTRFPANHRSY